MMNRTVFAFLVFVMSFGAGLCNEIGKSKNRGLSDSKVKIAIARHDIPEGKSLQRIDLQYKTIEFSRLSPIAANKFSQILERRVNRKILKGETITFRDIILSDMQKWTKYDELEDRKVPPPGYGKVVVPKIDVFQGSKLGHADVLLLERKLSRIPEGAIKSRKEVNGKIAKNEIPFLNVIKYSDLDWSNSD